MIDQFSVLAISDELKRVFSVTGNMVWLNRARLKAYIIGTTIYLG